MLSNILFDLDGTLTDSKDGVTRCLQYALEQLGQPCPNDDYVTSLIGLPLGYIFEELLHSRENDLIEEAIGLYLKRFSKIGIFENKIYPGIIESETA
jgi:phosphoglycolate phosphatase